MTLAAVSLDDKYALETGRVFLTGTQALVRLPMMQRQRDAKTGLNTAAFISGYRGSPLGALDQQLWHARHFLKNNHIHFQPGVNEDMAATAVWGSQQGSLFGDSTYDADQIYQGRKNALPRSSESEGSDFSPAGVGARGATLTVTRLEVLRDIYYVAAKWNPRDSGHGSYFHNRADCETAQLQKLRTIRQLFTDPNTWSIFSTRKSQEFKMDEDQFFVMGDNSPESEDCRLWTRQGKRGAKPGGPYLDRQLLIGKAVCVFWPHSWGGVPGIKVLPGFPGFGDMRIIR